MKLKTGLFLAGFISLLIIIFAEITPAYLSPCDAGFINPTACQNRQTAATRQPLVIRKIIQPVQPAKPNPLLITLPSLLKRGENHKIIKNNAVSVSE